MGALLQPSPPTLFASSFSPMSLHSSQSSSWPTANKLLAIVFSVGASCWPASCIYAGTKVSVEKRQPKIVVAQAATTSTGLAAQIAAGQQVYMMVCFACHQPTGLGIPSLFPPLAGSDWVNAPKPDRIIRNVIGGVMGPLQVNGKPFATPAPMMPPQGASLNDKQIADVLTYVRNSWGNSAAAVAPDQVKAVRDAEKAHPAMWSESELLKIPDR